jgi:hypothetical protein
MRIESENVRDSEQLLQRVAEDTEVVGIDEGQFFDMSLPAVCNALADRGKRVIVAGLDQDYLGRPFEPMPQLLAIAEYITKTLAICVVCGDPANHTQRLVPSSDRVLVCRRERPLRGALPPLLRPDARRSDPPEAVAAERDLTSPSHSCKIEGWTSSAERSSSSDLASSSRTPG